MNKESQYLIVFLTLVLIFTFSLSMIAANTLSIMATSDVYQYLMFYDYMEDNSDPTIGFSKTYSLIEEERVINETYQGEPLNKEIIMNYLEEYGQLILKMFKI
ncbi:hypothetical protein [Halanaerobium congolense]|jgi:hypothetical protein|uniref:Uncharacterized protein n=1 Tax=Halanaerobium congolense TaxID=54121 RepID=A0A4R7EAS0_9FIRM|nr:hypothetical protein [Halanaerobium congolense]TDS32372.1 hypothetical protein BY453_10746 [Halanaerobium congolense]